MFIVSICFNSLCLKDFLLGYNKTPSFPISDILKIDNLWFFTNLVKLNLDNNIIEKIQNLDSLIHLEWLGKIYFKKNSLSSLHVHVNRTKLKSFALYYS